ncbi:MAG: divergent polysaccharide deacetylase family protein [Desulforhopalus sp.]
MILRKKRKVRKKTSARKKKKTSIPVGRICAAVLLLVILIVSVCAVGYVIFFQTAFAADSVTADGDTVVFEEPNPPDHDSPGAPLPTVLLDELPKVAIIVDDLGYDERLAEKLLSSPLELTYSFLPFAPYTAKLEKKASMSGKTIFLHLPLEPKDKKWHPGPGALMLADSPEIHLAKLQECLKRVPHAIGVNTHMGSRFTEDGEAMAGLMEEIDRRSLLFVDSYTTAASEGLHAARKKGIPSGRRHIFLDNTVTVPAICRQMAALVELAEQQGWSIGIAHPHAVTVEAIARCADNFRSRVRFVDIREVLPAPPSSGTSP